MRSDHKTSRRRGLERVDIEAIWVEVTLDKKKTKVFGVIYRPPSADQLNFNNMLDVIEIAAEDSPIILGDLNYDYDWTNPLDTNPINFIEQVCGLRPLITEPTRVTPTSATL